MVRSLALAFCFGFVACKGGDSSSTKGAASEVDGGGGSGGSGGRAGRGAIWLRDGGAGSGGAPDRDGGATSSPPPDAGTDAGDDAALPTDCTPVAELCNGEDEDCDDKVDEDFQVGAPCDGPDSDRCLDGVVECAGENATVCTDDAASALDVCNGEDDDCDPTSGDGSEDPMLATPCDGSDSDECEEGTVECVDGELRCSDTTGDSIEQCGGGDEDCDGAVDEGITFDNNPACSGATMLGTIGGDTGEDTLTAQGHQERWFRVRILEESDSSIYLSARIQLQPPPGADFDLYVYCASCGGALAASSALAGDALDEVFVRAEDDAEADDSFEVLIEVRWFQSAMCANWELTVSGNWAASTVTCD